MILVEFFSAHWESIDSHECDCDFAGLGCPIGKQHVDVLDELNHERPQWAGLCVSQGQEYALRIFGHSVGPEIHERLAHLAVVQNDVSRDVLPSEEEFLAYFAYRFQEEVLVMQLKVIVDRKLMIDELLNLLPVSGEDSPQIAGVGTSGHILSLVLAKGNHFSKLAHYVLIELS